ncbi:uncharacterized protein [Ptychodera flava]|uniref:uncharacterized protein n=1 Tax=Ptychodera flava TaxID=63121 RepID=UPI003969DA3A
MDADSDFVFSVKRNVNVSFTKDPYPAMSDVDDRLTAVKRSSDERPVCFQECSQLWEEVRKANQVHRLGDCFVKVTMELFHRLRNDKLTSKEKVAILNFLCESGALQMDVSVSYGSEKSCVKPINTGVGGEKSSLSQKGREGEGHTRVDTEAETQGEVGKPSTYQTPEGTVTTADNRKMTQEGAVSTLGNMKTTQEGAMTTAGTRTTENEYTSSGHDIEKSLNTDSSKNCKDLPEGQFPSRSMHKNGTMTPQGGAIFAEHCHTIPHAENSMGISETNCFSKIFKTQD